jgi:hypothetical protein
MNMNSTKMNLLKFINGTAAEYRKLIISTDLQHIFIYPFSTRLKITSGTTYPKFISRSYVDF